MSELELTGSTAALMAAAALCAERDALVRRLADCEASLRAFDTHGSSEYWLRYPQAAPPLEHMTCPHVGDFPRGMYEGKPCPKCAEERSVQPPTAPQLYLIRKSGVPGRPAHIWTGKDTQCRMASTGGLSMRKYTVVDQLGDRPICQNCVNVGSQS